MKVSVVICAGGFFCCNYATDLCIYGNFTVTGMFVDLSVTIMQVTGSVAVMQLEVSAAHMQVTVSASNMWVTIFIVIMQMGVCCNYGGGIFCSALCTRLCLL